MNVEKMIEEAIKFAEAANAKRDQIERGEIVPVLISSNGLPALRAINDLVDLAQRTAGSITRDGKSEVKASETELLKALRIAALIALATMGDDRALAEGLAMMEEDISRTGSNATPA